MNGIEINSDGNTIKKKKKCDHKCRIIFLSFFTHEKIVENEIKLSFGHMTLKGFFTEDKLKEVNLLFKFAAIVFSTLKTLTKNWLVSTSSKHVIRI